MSFDFNTFENYLKAPYLHHEMSKKRVPQKIGILTAGGDCPGINAAIRGVGKTAIVKYGMKVIGISDGFSGLIHKEYTELTESSLSGILTLGGTILGTSREKPFKSEGKPKNELRKPILIKEHYEQLGLDCLVCIGGNGTMKTAHMLSQEGLNVVGIPKTIDNDIWGTDITFGFDSAVNIATEAIDRLHSTANSHKRIMVIELMGHNAGWLALYSGMAGGGDVILIPEIAHDEDIIMKYLTKRANDNKPYSIVVVAEGIRIPENEESPGRYFAREIQRVTGLETRETVLGYIQRGGTPSPMDRVLASRFGAAAANLIAQGKYGKMVAHRNGSISSIDLSEVAGKVKLVEADDPMVLQAKEMGTCFGKC
jgi:6-phosphofructokinase 1